jgi:capsular exopolysaccharide synthesis family protein
MSRIFDALERSKLDGDGFEFPLLTSLAPETPPAVEEESHEVTTDDPELFQSMPIAITPESRLISLTDPASLGAEKFRFLAVQMRQQQLVRPLKKVLVTSTIPEEGKSMVSANLALTLALRRNQRILLVDGDLRRPSLSARLGLPNLPGLSDWLQGSGDPIRNIYHLEDVGLWFLPAGELPDNPLELMQSGRLAGLLDHLATRFDWILIDSPPVLPLADTSVWARFADGVLLVTREGTSKKRELQRGLRALESTHLLGVVLNSSAPTDQSNYYQRYQAVGVTSKRS